MFGGLVSNKPSNMEKSRLVPVCGGRVTLVEQVVSYDPGT